MIDDSEQYKQLRQESGLCCFSFARNSQKCVTQIYRALYRDAMFVSFKGHKHAIEMKAFTQELRHIERNAFSSTRTV